MNYRVFVEKKEGFRVEAIGLQDELNANLGRLVDRKSVV